MCKYVWEHYAFELDGAVQLDGTVWQFFIRSSSESKAGSLVPQSQGSNMTEHVFIDDAGI